MKTKTKCTPRREVRFGRDGRLLGGVAKVGTRRLARVQTKIKEKAPNAIFALGPSTGSKLQKGCPALSASASIQAKEKSPNAHCVQTQSGATGRTRTGGLRITSALLYQLSHSSIGLPAEVGAIYYRVFFCFRQGAGV